MPLITTHFDMMNRPLVVIASGGVIETALLPYHLVHLRSFFELDVAVAVSTAALQFTTLTALQAISCSPVFHEGQPIHPLTQEPMHIALSNPAVLVIYPASGRILTSCATGLITCPVTRLFAFTPKDRIIIGACLHPKMDHRIYQPSLDMLSKLGCLVIEQTDSSKGSLWPKIEEAIAVRLSDCKRPEGETLSETLYLGSRR
jgi:phosphopantothenoylcysteine synthetase/decarboxylase